MKLIPLLFTDDMAAANLDGSKTETRRTRGLNTLNESPDNWIVGKEYISKADGGLYFPIFDRNSKEPGDRIKCPYGKPGDIIWQRETWRPKTHNFPTGPHYEYRATAKNDGTPLDGPWKPNIHMPLVACRYFGQITYLGLERIKDITPQGAIAEGVRSTNMPTMPEGIMWFDYQRRKFMYHGYNGPGWSYRSLITKINGPEMWDNNYWVWVIKYTVAKEQNPDMYINILKP